MTTLDTTNENTWCPGCPNFLILESAKKAISNLIAKGEKQENFALVTGIGCHAKIYDYINISGIYGLHGRVIPTAEGIKLGNSKLKVLGFAGDGDTYAEGMGHFIHAFRNNIDMTLIVHDNRAFSLTTGQATPTSQTGYVNKAEPLGEQRQPINPIKIALACGAGFVARVNARDIAHTAEIITKAVNYPGFAFVEVMQDCLIFNKAVNNFDDIMYKMKDNFDLKKSLSLADEWDYQKKQGKIVLGVIYQKK